jgi:hypothetical protein
MGVRLRFAVAVSILVLAAGALAQERRTYTIAVAVESSDGRVRNWAPELRSEAAAVVERSAPNVRAIIVTGSQRETREHAQRNRADYLLRIELSPRPYASVSVGSGPGIQDQEVSGAPRANMQGTIFLAWTVEPMADRKLKLHDSRLVQASEYPLGPYFDWLRAIASRSVRDGAAAAMGKLKSKKGIQP